MPATPDIAQSVHSASQAHTCFYGRSPGGLTPDFLMLSLLRRKRGKRSKHGFFWPNSPSAMPAGLASLRMLDKQWWAPTTLARTPTSTSLRWSRKRLGVQRWQDGRIWGDAVPLWFSACHARQPSVSRHAGVLFCAFPSLFCRPSSILRPIQSLTSERWRSSRPVDRCALVLRASCRNLERAERFSIATPTTSERVSWATKQRSLAVVGEDRHPLTCGPLTTAACSF
jgi:hypothetical protein